MEENWYAGVGSRKRPWSMKPLFVELGRCLAMAGWNLSSGAAEGIDEDFEEGCDQARGGKRIFLPWRGFNGHPSRLFDEHPDADAWVRRVHPAYEELRDGPRKMHARNICQVMGPTLNERVKFTVCWTPDGCESRAERRRGTGGTATAIVLSADLGIPVFNLAKPGRTAALGKFLDQLGVAHNLPEDKTVLGMRQDALF